jgi:hypothetical protein
MFETKQNSYGEAVTQTANNKDLQQTIILQYTQQ